MHLTISINCIFVHISYFAIIKICSQSFGVTQWKALFSPLLGAIIYGWPLGYMIYHLSPPHFLKRKTALCENVLVCSLVADLDEHHNLYMFYFVLSYHYWNLFPEFWCKPMKRPLSLYWTTSFIGYPLGIWCILFSP